jgi:hypothetical protein
MGAEADRQSFAILFWAFGDFGEQNAYILGCIKSHQVQRKYVKKENHSYDSRPKFLFK